jgi:hypothetical protein
MENTFISIEMSLIKSAEYKLATGNVMSWELISSIMIKTMPSDYLRPLSCGSHGAHSSSVLFVRGPE